MGRIVRGQYKRHLRMTPDAVPSERFASEKTEWKQAVCSVCLEAPHNAVLLLCSSHDKGCRPYMCGTSFRHSNCLDLFKKANAKPAITPSPNAEDQLSALNWSSCKKSEAVDLSCPLCRGKVKGWTVVEPARLYLNRKKRTCMSEGCSYVGSYKKLKKHVRDEHREAKPRKVDPALEAKWRALETQIEHQDVMSTIRSSMPGAVVLGDYVIDMNGHSSDIDDDFDDEFEDEDEFDDDIGGELDFLRGRRGGGGSSQGISHRDFLLFLSALQQQSSRLARIHRDNDGGGSGGGGAIGFQSSEDDAHTDEGRTRGRQLSLMRDGRRRQRRRRQGRSRGRSLSSLG